MLDGEAAQAVAARRLKQQMPRWFVEAAGCPRVPTVRKTDSMRLPERSCGITGEIRPSGESAAGSMLSYRVPTSKDYANAKVWRLCSILSPCYRVTDDG